MKFGVTFPYIDIHDFVQLAQEAEEAGWDGVFYWDGIFGTDPWISLAAAAMRTSRVKLGTIITPLSRRRPWKVAQETMTLDRLSNGRFILSVGLGAPETGFDKVGEETDRKKRAKMLDESLDIVAGFWSGKPFSYKGEHYQVQEVAFEPTPIQRPRIPVWVVGAWPYPKSMNRAARWDGLHPNMKNADGSFAEIKPADIQAMKAYIDEQRAGSTAPFDIILESESPGDDPEKAAATVRPWQEAGVTWWLEMIWHTAWNKGGVEGLRRRIQQGPPLS